jgi:hypothetical protein
MHPAQFTVVCVKCLIFGELACLGAFLGGVSVVLVTRRLEIEALILVLLTVWRVGVPDYGVKWEISVKVKLLVVTSYT